MNAKHRHRRRSSQMWIVRRFMRRDALLGAAKLIRAYGVAFGSAISNDAATRVYRFYFGPMTVRAGEELRAGDPVTFGKDGKAYKARAT